MLPLLEQSVQNLEYTKQKHNHTMKTQSMYGNSIQLKITEMTKPFKKHTEITQLNQPMQDLHTDQVHKLPTQKNHQVTLNHLMIKKSKQPLKLKDQHSSPPTLMTFFRDQFITTTPQETGSQKEELKPLPKKPLPPTKESKVQDSPNI